MHCELAYFQYRRHEMVRPNPDLLQNTCSPIADGWALQGICDVVFEYVLRHFGKPVHEAQNLGPPKAQPRDLSQLSKMIGAEMLRLSFKI